jgi:putative acetyltransferase
VRTPPAGIAVRDERPGDEPGVAAVVYAAFERSDEAQLVEALRADASWVLSLVAETTEADEPSRIVGHICFTRAHVDGQPVLALAPLAVQPDLHGRGIGTTLVEAGLAQAREAGETCVIVLGDPAYYGRFGFRPARESGVTGPFGDIDEFQSLGLGAAAPTGTIAYAGPLGLG